MNPTGDDQDGTSRRSFLRSSGGLLTGVWIAAHWPAIAAAAHHADEASAAPAPLELEFLNAAEAADIDAISGQIVPSGATPGAREAHAMHFIDRALATFFADWSQDFRAGLAQFQSAYRASKRRQEAEADARRAPAGRGPGWPESMWRQDAEAEHALRGWPWMDTQGLREAGIAQRSGHPGLARSRDCVAQWIHGGPENACPVRPPCARLVNSAQRDFFFFRADFAACAEVSSDSSGASESDAPSSASAIS